MALTKEQRDALPDSDFAVPGKRVLPIHDAVHVSMAWNMVDKAKNLSDEERSAARKRILTRAKSVGVDTADWNKDLTAVGDAVGALVGHTDSLAELRLEAMSLEMPDTPDHPNKMPFSGIMTRLDRPSDKPPSGSGGRKVILPRAVAERVLGTLLGMGIDYTPNLDGHNPTKKIGIIDEAIIKDDSVNGDYIWIAGFLYAADFPQQVARIQADKRVLGFSWELKNIHVENAEADPWVITECVFTGAAVLQKSKAAYTTTSLAANADGDIDMTTTEEILKALEALNGRLDKMEASAKEADEKKAKDEAVRLAAGHDVPAKVAPHSAAMRKLADDMEAAGIGCHASAGHVLALRKMAAGMDADASTGVVPSAWAPSGSVWSKADVAAAADTSVADAETAKTLKEIRDGLAALGTQVKDLQAAETKGKEPPERKTLAPHIVNLLARAQITAPTENGVKLEIGALDKALNAAGLAPVQRMEIKNSLAKLDLI